MVSSAKLMESPWTSQNSPKPPHQTCQAETQLLCAAVERVGHCAGVVCAGSPQSLES